jgi:predicted permease
VLLILQGMMALGIVAAVGVVAIRRSILNHQSRFAFEKLIYYVMLPCYVFHAFTGTNDPISWQAALLCALCTFFGAVLMVGAGMSFYKAARIPGQKLGRLAALPENVMLAFPFITLVWGEAAIQYAACCLVGLMPLRLAFRYRGKASEMALASLAALLGLAVNLTGLELPLFFVDSSRYIGYIALPLMVFCVTIRIYAAKHSVRPSRRLMTLALLRAVLAPVVVLIVCALLRLPKEGAAVAVVMAAMPADSNYQNYAFTALATVLLLPFYAYVTPFIV